MEKSDYFEITATVVYKYKVSFDEAVTFSEAKEMFLNDEYADINDEESIGTVSVDKVVMIG